MNVDAASRNFEFHVDIELLDVPGWSGRHQQRTYLPTNFRRTSCVHGLPTINTLTFTYPLEYMTPIIIIIINNHTCAIQTRCCLCLYSTLLLFLRRVLTYFITADFRRLESRSFTPNFKLSIRFFLSPRANVMRIFH